MRTETETPPPRTRERTVDKREVFQRHALFHPLTPQEIEFLATYSRVEHFAKGTTIFMKGDEGSGLMAPLKGQVRISVTSAEGKEIVLNIVRPGEVFGEIALLDGRPRSADAVTMTDCDVLVLDRREFIPFIKAHPDVALKLIEVLCARLRRTSEQVEDMLFLDLAARLAKTLLRLSRDLKSTTIAITQKDLGQMVGLSRESTNKQLRAWERRNWVKLVKGGVALTDIEALGEIAAADETEE